VSQAVDTSPLFTSFTLNKVTLPNRFVLPGMQRGWCKDGAPTDLLDNYYCRRVEGGAGLIISESVAVDHRTSTKSRMFAWLTDRTLDSWARCTGRVKAAGGHMLFQLWHEGAMRKDRPNDLPSDHPTLSPSGIAHRDKFVGRAFTGDELIEIKEAFVRSARLAQAAGADGVEVHAAHGYLLDQFLWPVTNRREDGYGGDDIADRVRFPAEIVAGIRAACGPDFIISIRYSQWKEDDYDAKIVNSSEELGIMLTALREAGVNVLHASTRYFWKPEWEGSDLNFAGWSRKLSGLPVITVGSVGLNIDIMDSLRGAEVEGRVEQGVAELVRRFDAKEFDLVSVGRSQIGDPDWVNKVREGRYIEVRTFKRSDLGKLDGSQAT
jgi:2,4-dienoyl-CoA reductase-like NADH-dependent reductase (Old Yellow Enzyme family)